MMAAMDAHATHAYRDILVLLAAAGLVVPLFHRLKINPVLGYLLAGALVGPDGLGRLAGALPGVDYVTVSSREAVAVFGELGVALLLFMIGIEISLRRLVTMRHHVFGLGGLQVVATSAMLTLAGILFGLDTAAAVILALALALSSTAIVVELLSRQKRMHSAGGRATFAVLLFQDLAVIPVLLLIPILARGATEGLASGFALALAQSAVAAVAIVLVGRYGLRPLLAMAAHAGGSEVFLATSLFAIVAVAVAAQGAGLSLTFGAFVAGLLIAETEFRREVETIIEPFKGLFLGLFFIAIGMSIDLDTIAANPLLVAGLAAAVMALKLVVMAAAGRLFGLPAPATAESAFLLAPCGEFGFVIVAAAFKAGLLAPGEAAVTVAAIAATMFTLPAFNAASVRARRHAERLDPPPEAATPPPPEASAHVVVAGYGRVGELIASILAEHRIPFVAVDSNVDVVMKARKAGQPVYYGDAARPEFLARCGIGAARGLVVTMDSAQKVHDVVENARRLRADLPIVARAHDDRQALALYGLGVTAAVPETIEASLQLGEALLDELGVPMGVAIASIHERRDGFRRRLGWVDRRKRAGLSAPKRQKPGAEPAPPES
jgi:CPA2 family monovalent cation:H+ antiporter-2